MTGILLLSSLTAVIPAQKIYISPSGKDSNDGSFEKPLASLPAAIEMTRVLKKPGIAEQKTEIIAMKGDYFMSSPLILTSADSREANTPLIIKSESGQQARFLGGVPLAGFEKVNDNLWRTFIPQVAWNNSYFEQLYVNGKRAVRARTPNKGFYYVKSAGEAVIEKGDGSFPLLAVQKIGLDSVDSKCFSSFSKDDYQDALIIFYHNWDNTRKRVTGFDPNSFSVFTTGEGMKPWNPINEKSRYLVENCRSALDSPGEWYLDRTGYLYYIPKEGETIENTTFVAPVIGKFIDIKGDSVSGKMAQNIRFENLSFEYAGYQTPPAGNEPAQAAFPLEAVITLDYANNIEFLDCEVAHTGTYGFWFRRACNNCYLIMCYLHDLGGGGVKIGETSIRDDSNQITKNISVNNNIIRDGGHVFPCAAGIIVFNASDNNLTHNEIADFRYTGISVGWVWGYDKSPTKRNKIEFNHIHHLGWGELCDMGGVYTLGASEGTTVSNNVIHHIYSYNYGGWGLYTDEGSTGIKEENNLVYACKNAGFHQHYGKDNIIRNNIFAFNLRSALQATRIEDHNSFSFSHNIVLLSSGTLLSSNWSKILLGSDSNCYWDLRTKDITFGEESFSEWKKSGKDLHSVISDPFFTNPSGFDFHFKKLKTARQIGFIPFDYSKAGVYGSDDWKKLALSDDSIAKQFDEAVTNRERISGK